MGGGDRSAECCGGRPPRQPRVLFPTAPYDTRDSFRSPEVVYALCPQHLNASDLPFLVIARKPEPPPGSARASLGGLGWVSRCAFWRLWRCKFRQSRDRETAHLSSDRDRGATAPSSRPRRCSVRPPLQFPRHRAVVTSTLRRVHSSRPVAPVVLVQRHQPATHHPARPAAPRRAPLPSARPPVSPSPRRLVNATARG